MGAFASLPKQHGRQTTATSSTGFDPSRRGAFPPLGATSRGAWRPAGAVVREMLGRFRARRSCLSPPTYHLLGSPTSATSLPAGLPARDRRSLINRTVRPQTAPPRYARAHRLRPSPTALVSALRYQTPARECIARHSARQGASADVPRRSLEILPVLFRDEAARFPRVRDRHWTLRKCRQMERLVEVRTRAASPPRRRGAERCRQIFSRQPDRFQPGEPPPAEI
jgi:hypothetical protein